MIRIPKNTTIVGELRSSGEIRIDGRFEGQGLVEGTLILTESCVWIGNIIADTVVIEGVVEGDIIARKRLLVGPHARINGNVKSPAIGISNGAKLFCHVDMLKPGEPTALLEHKPSVTRKNIDEVAKLKNKSKKTA